MGRRKRGNRSATEFDRETEGVNDDTARKVPRIEPYQSATSKFRLSEDQEDRLGRWSSSVQWIMKIAQDRGCNTCLAFLSAEASHQSVTFCKLAMQTFDGQQMSVVIRGDWAERAASVLKRAVGGELLLLSGIGAKIPSSGSEVIFESGKMIAEVINADTLQSQGCFEVADGQIVSMPKESIAVQHTTRDSEVVVVADQNNAEREESVEGELRHSNSPAIEQQVLSSPYQTPLRNNHSKRQATSVTPAWLRTPATETHIDASIAGPSSSRSESEPASSIPTNATRSNALQEKLLSTRLYTPISLLRCDERTAYNLIGLTTTDHTARRALSGTRDWKITINLMDVEGTPMKSPVIPFNLFSREEDWLPRGKIGSIVLLRGIKVREFNSAPQGSGYAGQYEWALMDTSEADDDKALTSSSMVWTAERKELKRLYDWYRKHRKGHDHAIVPTRVQRPLIKLCDVEKEVFFDTTVEIVKIWTGSSPPQIYVTDYTSHPQFYAANDVHLDGFSREELQKQQEECNDAGNGRVLPISFWDDQQSAINLVHLGMLVRLENVRPKMQPNEYLGGTMGGSGRIADEKLKVIIVKDRRIIEDFKNRKEEYLQEVAVRRAERLTAMHQQDRRQEQLQLQLQDQEDEEEREDTESQRIDSSNSTASFRVPSLMPPPGQKPLSVILNRSYEPSETSTSTKTTDSQISEQEEMPTIIEESLSALPLIPLSQLYHMPLDLFKQGRSFLCLARVHAILPDNLDEIVEVVCGLCKSWLPADHAFCTQCAEEDGKELRHRFNFALLIESVVREESNEDTIRIPVVIRDEDAKQLLHGFHPKDVRNRKSTLDRLKHRLEPLLGSELLSSSQEHQPRPFRLVIQTSLAKAADGTLQKKFRLIGTRLGKL